MRTKLMTLLFSAESTPEKQEVIDQIAEADEKGSSDSKEYSISKAGDKLYAIDKSNEEITSLAPKEKDSTEMQAEAVKCASEDESIHETVTITPEEVAEEGKETPLEQTMEEREMLGRIKSLESEVIRLKAERLDSTKGFSAATLEAIKIYTK